MWVDVLDDKPKWVRPWLYSVFDRFTKYSKGFHVENAVDSKKLLVEFFKSELQYPSFIDSTDTVWVHLPDDIVVYYKLKYE